MFMIFHASNVKLATVKYRIISRQLGSFEVLFSRPAEVSVAMGEWATVNFCPWCHFAVHCGFSTKKNIKSKHNFESGHFQTFCYFI